MTLKSTSYVHSTLNIVSIIWGVGFEMRKFPYENSTVKPQTTVMKSSENFRQTSHTMETNMDIVWVKAVIFSSLWKGFSFVIWEELNWALAMDCESLKKEIQEIKKLNYIEFIIWIRGDVKNLENVIKCSHRSLTQRRLGDKPRVIMARLHNEGDAVNILRRSRDLQS